ncbi:MAG: phosphatidylserine decarboxylase [Thermoplasmata archaeon]|nr:phosphatidylserine decarboxylase [Thermoplasmata archaeon]
MFAAPGRRILCVVAILCGATAVLSIFWHYFVVIATGFLALLIFFAWFFRDPERKIGEGIVSPADGVVTDAGEREGCQFISIFMNLHDVHVNRAPEEGKILSVKHFPGKHRVAFGNRVNENEHALIEMETGHGRLRVIQIAGIFARRISTYVKPGDRVKKGDRIGIIFLGSRVCLYLPAGAMLRVKKGAKVRAGETTIGVWKNAVDKKNLGS